MFRDVFDINDSARYTAYLSGGMGVSTMLGPALSGYLIETSGWRMSFFAMTVLALVVFILLLPTMTETRQRAPAAGSALGRMAADFSHLVRSRLFWGYTLVYGFANAAFFTFLTSAPLYFKEHLFTGPALFGIYMGSMAFAYICGSMTGSRIIRLHGSERTLQLGLCGDFLQRRTYSVHTLVFAGQRRDHHFPFPAPVRIYRTGQPAIHGRRHRAPPRQSRNGIGGFQQYVHGNRRTVGVIASLVYQREYTQLMPARGNCHYPVSDILPC